MIFFLKAQNMIRFIISLGGLTTKRTIPQLYSLYCTFPAFNVDQFSSFTPFSAITRLYPSCLCKPCIISLKMDPEFGTTSKIDLKSSCMGPIKSPFPYAQCPTITLVISSCMISQTFYVNGTTISQVSRSYLFRVVTKCFQSTYSKPKLKP